MKWTFQAIDTTKAGKPPDIEFELISSLNGDIILAHTEYTGICIRLLPDSAEVTLTDNDSELIVANIVVNKPEVKSWDNLQDHAVELAACLAWSMWRFNKAGDTQPIRTPHDLANLPDFGTPNDV